MSEAYMMNRATKILLVVLTSAIAGSIASMFVNTAGAAEECLAKPKGETPQGQHWRYRIDRGTKRQCWYLRDKDDASSQAAVSVPSDKTASPDRKNETLLTRSTADAYAALSSSGSRSDGGSQIQPVTQTPSVNAGIDVNASPHDDAPTSDQSPVATRWPDPTGVLSPSIERSTTSSFAVASGTPDPTTDAATAGAEVSPTANASPTTVSLQMLVLAAFGALAFSGLTGGAIYFARVRRRPQHDDATSRWPGWAPPDDAYRLYAPLSRVRPADSPRGPETHSVDRLTSSSSENGEEIAQLLARFANQAEAER
jgi:hypothetical protein